MPDSQPLPVRTDPLPGEFWLGYVQRVAARFGVGWADVMGPVLPEQNLLNAGRHAGFCVGEESARRLASYFRLEPEQVGAMHLESVFGGSVLLLDDAARAQFDPWPTVSASGGPVRLTGCGPVRNHDRRVSCPACCARTPGLMRLDWQVILFPACEEHGLLLTPDDTQEVGADPEVLQVQAILRARLTDHPHNARFFEHLETVIRSLLGLSHTASLIRPSPAELGEVLPAALRDVRAEGFPLSQGLVRAATDGVGLRRGLVSSRPAQRLVAPTPPIRSRAIRSRANAADPVATFPRRLPASLFAGDISDLLYEPAMNATSRRSNGRTVPEEIAAVTVAMARSGRDAETSVEGLFDRGPRILHGIANDVVFALAEVEQHGRLEDYWAAVGSASCVLRREGVNYHDRRALLHDPTFTHAVLRIDAAPPEVIWVWLSAEWAGDALPAHAPGEAFLAHLGRSTLDAVTPALTEHLLAAANEASAFAS